MVLTSLHDLFAPGALLRDGDADGIPDGVAAALYPTDDLASQAGALELAGRLGLEATGLTLPLVGGAGECPVHIGPNLVRPGTLALPAPGQGLIAPAPSGGLLITAADGAGVLAAARYLAARYPYLQELGEGQPVVPAGATALYVGTLGVTAVQTTTGWSPVASPGHGTSTPLVDGAPAPSAPPAPSGPLTSLGQLYTAGTLQFALHADQTPAERTELIHLAARLGVERTTLRFPLAVLPGEQPTGDPLVTVARSGAGAAVVLQDGQVQVSGAAALHYLATSTDLATLPTRLTPPPAPAAEEPYAALAYQGEWEVDRFRRLWQARVAPTLAAAAPVAVDLRLSEPLAVRQALQGELLAQLPPGSTVHVRSCFKQGLHWIREEVIPALTQVGSVARVELQFRRFSSQAPAGEKSLEMAHRWLQECYPADSLLATALSIPEAAITFAMVDATGDATVDATGDDSPTYTLTAFDAHGAALATYTYEARTGLRRYLDAFPERGWIHPPTGSLVVNGQDCGALPTDAEQFWDWYQSTVLTSLRALVVSQHGERPETAAQPLFGTLRFDVWLSEENARLGVREEHISPLDSLHEDLYFVTLDYMATWGRQLHNQPFGAPGTILPFIHSAAGEPPRASVSLSRGQGAPPLPVAPDVIGLTLSPTGTPQTATLADGRTVAVPAAPPCPLDTATPVATISLHDVIGPEQLPGTLAYLRTLPGVQVWQAGVSYLGRPCYAIELRLPVHEQITPAGKASAFKPMLLINARHHANEVSSTNAVLKLVERAALGEPELVAYLRRCNLVINPLENMDGAATHYAMQAEHATWKLHSARFNAVGLEFYGQYIEPQTPYTEARVLQDLFRDFQPDVLLDDHGVPAHEWLQPFAGYSSAPYFRVSYWLPSALLYGIFRDLDEQRYPHQVQATRALRSVLTSRVRAATEVYAENQQWLAIYRKWGADWVPAMFPVELHDDMICYTWPAGPHVFSVRFPETCVVDWVTEVPDETAQGDHLRKTAEAHLVGEIASWEFLAQHPQPLVRSAQSADGGVRRQVGRARPFVTTAS